MEGGAAGSIANLRMHSDEDNTGNGSALDMACCSFERYGDTSEAFNRGNDIMFVIITFVIIWLV